MNQLDCVISIPIVQDYYFRKYRYRVMQEWLDERDIEYFGVKTMDGGDIPHTIVMDSESALAFKLVFKL